MVCRAGSWCHGAIHRRHDRGRHQPDFVDSTYGGMRKRRKKPQQRALNRNTRGSSCFVFPFLFALVVPAFTWEYASFVFDRICVGLVSPGYPYFVVGASLCKVVGTSPTPEDLGARAWIRVGENQLVRPSRRGRVAVKMD